MKFELIEINDLYTENYNGTTHDLEVLDDHSYNIENIIVHNSVCLTRMKAGVGIPQLSAVIECADAAHGLGARICSDGGCQVPGDVSKAMGGGADFVMLGGMLSSHEESEMVFNKDGIQYVRFYGSSSEEAMAKHHGGVAKHRSSEGKSVELLCKGPVENTILDILGGLRSTLTYVGATELRELTKRTTFVRVTQQLNPLFGNTK